VNDSIYYIIRIEYWYLHTGYYTYYTGRPTENNLKNTLFNNSNNNNGDKITQLTDAYIIQICLR